MQPSATSPNASTAFDPEPIAVPAERARAGLERAAGDLRDALELAHRRIQEFHQRQRPQDISVMEPTENSSDGAGDRFNGPGSMCPAVARLIRARF